MKYDQQNPATTHIALADLDADGDLDVIVTNVDSETRRMCYPGCIGGQGFYHNAPPVALFENDGSGNFNNAWALSEAQSPLDHGGYGHDGQPFHVSIGDLDGDGDPDIFIVLGKPYDSSSPGTGTRAQAACAG